MVQISCPSIIHSFTFISFSQLLIVFLLWSYTLMEALNLYYFIIHMIKFIIFNIHFKLISELGRCYNSLKGRYMVNFTILQLYKELIVLIFLLFGNEYAQIYFPFQIMFVYHIMFAAGIIHIILLLHRMMSYKEALLFFLANTIL